MDAAISGIYALVENGIKPNFRDYRQKASGQSYNLVRTVPGPHGRSRHCIGGAQEPVTGARGGAGQAFAKENALSAWRKTGIFLFNPEMVLSKLPAALPVAVQSSAELGTSTRQLRLKVGMVSRRAAARLTLVEHKCSNLEKALALERRKRKCRDMEGYGGALFVDTGVLQKAWELEQLQADAKEREGWEEQEKAQRACERAEAKPLKAAETLRKRQERQAAKDARIAAKARKKAKVAARKAAAQR
ncbi:hypothetical protein K470DRAFT_257944 [Piedraia hortae CBS 480.64]|uniref:Uncharacterized protein n=1 Tax=Piedraia hortae CBS 480.64 TaxID=1314780 RepID=A0A6A7C0G2_9PEZI|nr:hypothetical protein K470DRAFT_257944 [Piedraia hortae CBS 480.64]